MPERLTRMVVAGGLSLWAGCAVAGGQTFTPPEGCTAFLTVQLRECRVEHHYECADTGTDRFRIVYTQDGPNFLSRIDADAQWISSVSLPDGAVTETVQPVDAPISVKALLEKGEHAFEFSERWPDGRVIRAEGSDRIVERDVEIDGEPLHRTVFELVYTDESGAVVETYSGAEYVSERHMRFFSGKGRTEQAGAAQAFTFDQSPRAFIYEGEPGFLSTTPRYDCGALMSSLALPEGWQ